LQKDKAVTERAKGKWQDLWEGILKLWKKPQKPKLKKGILRNLPSLKKKTVMKRGGGRKNYQQVISGRLRQEGKPLRKKKSDSEKGGDHTTLAKKRRKANCQTAL